MEIFKTFQAIMGLFIALLTICGNFIHVIFLNQPFHFFIVTISTIFSCFMRRPIFFLAYANLAFFVFWTLNLLDFHLLSVYLEIIILRLPFL
jgi:hypothetical protein